MKRFIATTFLAITALTSAQAEVKLGEGHKKLGEIMKKLETTAIEFMPNKSQEEYLKTFLSTMSFQNQCTKGAKKLKDAAQCKKIAIETLQASKALNKIQEKMSHAVAQAVPQLLSEIEKLELTAPNN